MVKMLLALLTGILSAVFLLEDDLPLEWLFWQKKTKTNKIIIWGTSWATVDVCDSGYVQAAQLQNSLGRAVMNSVQVHGQGTHPCQPAVYLTYVLRSTRSSGYRALQTSEGLVLSKSSVHQMQTLPWGCRRWMSGCWWAIWTRRHKWTKCSHFLVVPLIASCLIRGCSACTCNLSSDLEKGKARDGNSLNFHLLLRKNVLRCGNSGNSWIACCW